jgi:hypothetical protein
MNATARTPPPPSTCQYLKGFPAADVVDEDGALGTSEILDFKVKKPG